MGQQKRILVVEDSTTQAMRLQHLLKAGGIDSAVANGGQQAIDLLASNSEFDAILSDIDMPEMDGFQLCGKVKQMPSASKIPFVMLVSLKDIKDVARSMQSGADNMLMKEYDKAYFLPQLERIIAECSCPANGPLQKLGFDLEGEHFEVEMPAYKIASMLVSTFSMAVHQKAAKLPVAGKV